MCAGESEKDIVEGGSPQTDVDHGDRGCVEIYEHLAEVGRSM